MEVRPDRRHPVASAQAACIAGPAIRRKLNMRSPFFRHMREKFNPVYSCIVVNFLCTVVTNNKCFNVPAAQVAGLAQVNVYAALHRCIGNDVD